MIQVTSSRRLLAAEIFRKMSGATSSRGHTALTILRLGYVFHLLVAFLLSHSSRFLRHSVSVGATHENNSPSVWR